LQFSFINFPVFVLQRLIKALFFSKNGIFDDFRITLALLPEKEILKTSLKCFNKAYHFDNVCQNYKSKFKFVEVIQEKV